MASQTTKLAFCIFCALIFCGNGNVILSSDAGLLDVAQQLRNIDQKLGTIASLLARGGNSRKDERDPDECYKGMASVTRNPRMPITVLGDKVALCDTMSDGGGWVVMQRRSNGRESFYRSWKEYKFGFGDVVGGGDFWIGNDVIHQLTASAKFELRTDIEDDEGKMHDEYCSSFYVGSEASSYNLTLGDHGTKFTVLSFHNNTGFSTFDRDNDAVDAENLAERFRGGWWYNEYKGVNLNGVFGSNGTDRVYLFFGENGWPTTSGFRFVEMKMRLVS